MYCILPSTISKGSPRDAEKTHIAAFTGVYRGANDKIGLGINTKRQKQQVLFISDNKWAPELNWKKCVCLLTRLCAST